MEHLRGERREALVRLGHRIGGAEVSDKYANFSINRGDASAGVIAALIEHVQQTIERHTGVRLVPEARPIGGDSQ